MASGRQRTSFCSLHGIRDAKSTSSAAAKRIARWLSAWVQHGREMRKDDPGAKLDAAIIFAPAGGLVPLALKATRKGATVALAGITMSPIPQLDYDLLYHERVLRSVANSTRRDVEEFLELAAEVPVKTEVMEFTLENANLALQKLKNSEIDGAAVLRIAG